MGEEFDQPEKEQEPEHTAGLHAFEALGRFLAEDGWHPQQLEGKTIYRTNFLGKNGELRCYAQIHTELQQFIFYAVATTRAPEEVRLAVAEFITRANYGLRIGNFEMDYSDGEVRYKSSIDFEGIELAPNLIRNAIYPAVQTMDRYLMGLMRVMYGGQTPYEAIAEIEGSQ
ncbi:MAG: YbjN domain-containing protein [Anaerolineae bacterium]|nr:YbjN domain-containing protein [Anaerolineae bacterium]